MGAAARRCWHRERGASDQDRAAEREERFAESAGVAAPSPSIALNWRALAASLRPLVIRWSAARALRRVRSSCPLPRVHTHTRAPCRRFPQANPVVGQPLTELDETAPGTWLFFRSPSSAGPITCAPPAEAFHVRSGCPLCPLGRPKSARSAGARARASVQVIKATQRAGKSSGPTSLTSRCSLAALRRTGSRPIVPANAAAAED